MDHLEELLEVEVPIGLVDDARGEGLEEAVGAGDVDVTMAKNLTPMLAKSVSSCNSVNIVLSAFRGSDVGDGNLGALGRPEHDPSLQAGLIVGGSGVVVQGLKGALGGGDRGISEKGVKAGKIERAKTSVEMRA